MKYSHKLFFACALTLSGLALPVYVNQWAVWAVYVFGFALGIILVIQTLSKNAYGPLFKTVVYKFNHWISLDDKENNQTNFKNHLFTSGGVAGVFGILAYLALKLFVDIGVISAIESEAIISFLLGALAGLFLMVAYLAYRIEQRYKDNDKMVGNKPLEINQKVVESEPVVSITLTENELVACIALLNNDLKDVPLDKVVESLVNYNLGKKFVERSGLKDSYEFEMILQGLRGLEEKGLVVGKDADKTLIILTGVISFGDKMADGTYYGKDLNITANYSKGTNGDYVLKLVSDKVRKTQGLPVGKKLAIISLVTGIVVVGIYLFMLPSKEGTLFEPVLIDKSSEVNLTALGDNKLAYVKNGDIFLADKNGVEQITSGHTVSNIKASQDGKYLGWIENKKFTLKNGGQELVGTAVSTYNINNQTLTYDVVSSVSKTKDESDDDSGITEEEIADFIFSPLDNNEIIYIRNGSVWKWKGDDEETLLFNLSCNLEYFDLKNDNKIHHICFPDITETYDLVTEKLIKGRLNSYLPGQPTDAPSGGLSMNNDKYIVYGTSNGGYEGGLWLYDRATGRTSEILKKEDDVLSVQNVTKIDESSLLLVIEPFMNNSYPSLPVKETAIYQFSITDKILKYIKTADVKQSHGLFLTTNKKVIFLENTDGDQWKEWSVNNLRMMDIDGQNDQLIVEGISEYAWIPAISWRDINMSDNISFKTSKDWNIYEDFTNFAGHSRHLITSYEFDRFTFPVRGQYAILVGIEDNGISSDLYSWMENNNVLQEKVAYKDDNRSCLTRYAGIECFVKVDDSILVVFIYDNGDRVIDAYEKEFIENVKIIK